jgi:hypothetical protein
MNLTFVAVALKGIKIAILKNKKIKKKIHAEMSRKHTINSHCPVKNANRK